MDVYAERLEHANRDPSREHMMASSNETFARYWPFVRGIHLTLVDSPHKRQRRAALMFSFIYGWVNGWAYNRYAGDLRHHRAHFDVKIQIHTLLIQLLLIIFIDGIAQDCGDPSALTKELPQSFVQPSLYKYHISNSYARELQLALMTCLWLLMP